MQPPLSKLVAWVFPTCWMVLTWMTEAITVPAERRHVSTACAPLWDELGFTKSDIREAARRIDLPVWDKPALACLSSRFPYGTPITPERLTQVGRCERVLRDLGFRVYRVRYHGSVARIEVAPEELQKLWVPRCVTSSIDAFGKRVSLP